MTPRPLTVRSLHRDAGALRIGFAQSLPFVPGQFLTLQHPDACKGCWRSYSICSEQGAPLEIAIRKVEGGAFSAWAHESLREGMVLRARPPQGRFCPKEVWRDGCWQCTRPVLAFAGGSGITPVLPILRAALAQANGPPVMLVYCNRSYASVMFREEIEDLKNRYLGRFSVLHMVSDMAGDGAFSGRLDALRIARLACIWPAIGQARSFICGPEPLTRMIRAALERHGHCPAAIHTELFGARAEAPVPRAKEPEAEVRVTAVIEAARYSFPMAQGETLLDALQSAGIEAPHACKAGVCATCRCRVLAGKMAMRLNHGLEDGQVERGYVLACQAVARSAEVTVNFDD